MLQGTKQPPAAPGQGCEGWLGACLHPALGFLGVSVLLNLEGLHQVLEVGCSL